MPFPQLMRPRWICNLGWPPSETAPSPRAITECRGRADCLPPGVQEQAIPCAFCIRLARPGCAAGERSALRMTRPGNDRSVRHDPGRMLDELTGARG